MKQDPAPLILLVETATPVCSVALSRGDTLLTIRESHGRSHSESIAVFAQEILTENGLQPNDIVAIAVSEGPGSYTGLRIGVSFAKGLCYSLRIPLISVPTLEALAFSNAARVWLEKHPDGQIVSMIDARRMEVYYSVFNRSGGNEAVPAIIDAPFLEQLCQGKPTLLIGDGAAKCAPPAAEIEWITVQPELGCSAAHMVVPALHRFSHQTFCDLAYFEPNYVKPARVTTPGKKTTT